MGKPLQPLLMDHRVDVYVPSQCICTNPLPEKLRESILREVAEKLDDWFDNHSEIAIKGNWRLPDGTIAKEEVSDIYSFCTAEALEQHQEDVDQLAVDIANRLTQDRVLRVFDNLKAALWPNTLEDLKPQKNCACHGGATVGVGTTAQQTGIGKADRLSKMLVIQGILRSFNSVDHARKLFCDLLHYHYASGELPCANWPGGIRSMLNGAPTLLADHNGFKILYLRISGDELRRGAERQVIQRICKDDPTFRGLIVVSDQGQKGWELVNVKARSDDSNRMLLRRMRVGVEAVRTATERMAILEITEAEEASIPAEELQSRHDKAFDVEAVTKQFFSEVANWYFWALKHARFPKDAPKEKDGHDHVSLIRLITRLVFCWFVKEKGLIPPDLFNERKLAELLVGFAPGKVSNKDSVFYKAILQNLFFATLNTEMAKRDWRRNGQNFMAHSLYRHKDLFVRPNEALTLFKNIPFLNGGLFECLDRILGNKANPRYERIDGFSDREDSQPTVPDFLFFGEERELDLSEDYGDNKFRKVKVRGLIHILNHYRFTIEESTPLEEEVALDPELAGKIFENLLAAYNPETGATARKQTGSFYTPRVIVNYMVDEALIAYLKGKVEESLPKAADVEARLRHLFSYEEEGHHFTPDEVEVLIAGIDQLKALDPAVGSGAFPMGILHKLVFILGRLDPRNEMWKERQKQRLRDAMATAERIEDSTIRENTLRELELQLAGIDEAFEKNTLDYGRKLYLIENCLYGVDIQPIAVQIAKMRFFISLIADQKVDPSAENFGVRPLPNLETKLVAANTLIGIDKPKQLMLRNPQIDALGAELRRVRERHFIARTPTAKAKCREQDHKLRIEIAELLKKDGWDNTTAKQLAGWDPYDQNSSSEFFDPEWMFGVQDGFNVVTGNPPYGVCFSEEEKDQLLSLFQHQDYQLDSYLLFTERAFHLLCDGGVVAFIIPNPWLTNLKLKKVRRFIFTQQTVLQIVHYSRKVFDATVDTQVVIIKRGACIGNKVQVKIVREYDSVVTQVVDQQKWATLNGEPINIFVNPAEERIIEKIGTDAHLLKDLCTVTVGMKPYQVGKGIPKQTPEVVKKRVFDSTYRKDKSYRPLLRGRDIDKYAIKWKGDRWIKYGDHLAEPRPSANFGAPIKIVIRQTGDSLIAALDTDHFVCMNNMHIIIPRDESCNLLFILGSLNSRLLNYFFQWLNPEKGEALAEVKKAHVEKLPIKRTDSKQMEQIIRIVGQVLQAKKRDREAETTGLEREIDRLVYRIYGLTENEIKIVEDGR